jgi:uncharacterized protein YceH (UPF0502 family)
MLPLDLSVNECRVIGCLMEKSVTTPDQYPLTLNALTNACNQKSSREPVMALNKGAVQHTLRELEGRHLIRLEENFGRGIEKYAQRFCNTSFSELQFDSAGFAIVCLLLLRGPQTPGELRARSGRLHEFADNNEALEALTALIEYENDPLAIQLPRTQGRKDSEYMHLFAGPIDIDAHAVKAATALADRPVSSPVSSNATLDALVERVSELEAEVEKLKNLLP